MAALSARSQEGRVIVVDSLLLSDSEADHCLRLELQDMKDELADIYSHFVRRRQFRHRIYNALDDPNGTLFHDAEGTPLSADDALEVVMDRLRHNKVDMMALLESTRALLCSAGRESNQCWNCRQP